jgi:hypothetical protein
MGTLPLVGAYAPIRSHPRTPQEHEKGAGESSQEKVNREISGPRPEQGVQHTRLVLRTCKDTVRNVLDIKKPGLFMALS